VGLISYYVLSFAGVLSRGDVQNLPDAELGQTQIETVLRAVFGFAGGIALIMVVIGGFKYITSLGNAQNIAKAKDTILYALIGLAVCILGYAIVGFVITRTG
jgi:hypothetical protein